MRLHANERIELENAIGTLARIEMRLLRELGSQDALSSRVQIEAARLPIKDLLKETE